MDAPPYTKDPLRSEWIEKTQFTHRSHATGTTPVMPTPVHNKIALSFCGHGLKEARSDWPISVGSLVLRSVHGRTEVSTTSIASRYQRDRATDSPLSPSQSYVPEVMGHMPASHTSATNAARLPVVGRVGRYDALRVTESRPEIADALEGSRRPERGCQSRTPGAAFGRKLPHQRLRQGPLKVKIRRTGLHESWDRP